MRARRTLRTLAAVLAVAAGLTLTGAPTGRVGAAQLDASGWWWKLQTGQLVALPAPPGTEDGRLLVQGSPDEASAIAAVRFALGPTETAPVLNLRLAEGSDVAATALVLACPAATAWRPGTAQAWGQKPETACDRQALGVLSEDGATMSFDLSAFAAGPIVDLVLLPGRVEGLPPGADGSVFTLIAEAPAATDLVTVPAGTPLPAGPPAVSSGPPAAPAPTPSGPVGRTAPLPSFRPPAVAVVPSLPVADLASPAATPGGSRLPAAPVVALPDPASNPARGVAASLVAVVLGAAAWSARRELAARVGVATAVAPGDTEEIGGIGRFARPRSGPPPTLT